MNGNSFVVRLGGRSGVRGACRSAAFLACALGACGAWGAPIHVTSDTTVTTSNYSMYKDADIDISSGVYLTFAPVSGETFEFRGILSGDGGLKMTGEGDLALYGNNTFGGVFLVSAGNLHVHHDKALGAGGSTANRTSIEGTGMVYFHGVTTPEYLSVNRDGRPLVSAAGTKNYFSGFLSSGNTYGFIEAQENSEFHVTGWFSHNAWGYLCGKGKIFLEGHAAIRFFIGISADSTDVTISTPIERLGTSEFSVCLSGGWGKFLRFGCADVMKDGCLELGTDSGDATANAYVYLNGYDQTCSSLNAHAAGPAINSTSPAQIRSGRLTNNKWPGKLPWRFESYAGFTWTGEDKVTLTVDSPSQATLGVEGGSMELEEAATWLNAANVVVKGGALKVNSVAFGEQVCLSLSEGGTIEIPSGVQLTVKKLFIDGVEQVDGVWGKSGTEWTDAHFIGEGTVKALTGARAPDSPATWDAGGEDTELSRKENWVGDPTYLNVTRGSLLATFAQTGEKATVGSSAALRGIVFDAPADFAIDGAAELSLLSGGIETRPPASGTRTYSVSVPLRLTESQRWTVTNGTSVVLSGTVSGDSTATVALDTSAALLLDGATVGAPFKTEQSATAILRVATNTVSTFTAKAELRNALLLEKGSELRFTGGCDMVGYGSSGVITPQSNGAGSRLIFSGKSPRFFSWFYLTNENWSDDGVRNSLEVAFNVADCHFWNLGLYVCNNNVASCGADYALNYTGGIGLTGGVIGGTGYLKLNGHDQGVTWLEASDPATKPAQGTGRILSDAPAALHVRSDAVTTNYAVFEGLAGLAKEGTNGNGVMTLGAASPTYGSIEVSNGTLAFGENASWYNCSNVTVKGTGVLKLSHGRTFARHTEVTIADSGKVELAEGVLQRVNAAYRQTSEGKVKLLPGSHGATGSGADHIDDALFVGKGRLYVRGAGLLLLVR